MTDSELNILESSLSCCSKCKGLFKTSKDDNDKHWITCSGNPFKSPTNYFACERKIFLQLFQPEDFQLDGSFNLQNISKDDSFLNQVVKVRLPQETIDPFMFLRNYTSTGPSTLQESDLDLLDQNIPDLDAGGEKDGSFAGDQKSSYGTNVEEDQIQKIINKNIDFLKHEEIHELHSGSSKGPFTESPPESRLLSPIEKHLNFLTDGTKSGLQSPFDKTESFLPDATVPYQGNSIEYTSVQPVPFSCRLSSDLLGDLTASQDGNQSFQHLELQKKDPFLGQNPGLAQINSKDPFLINASVRSEKVTLTGSKYVPPSTRNVFDMQTSPTFQLQDGNYFNFPSTLDEPTQLDYLDLATIDFLTNPSFTFGHDKNEVNNSDTSNKQEQPSTSRTIESFEKTSIFPTETRDDSAVDRKLKRLKIKKVKNRLQKKTKSSANNETNSCSKLSEVSPRSRRHSSRETEKAVMKITQSKKLIGQSNEAPENSAYSPKISSRKRKLSLPSTLEVGPLEGLAKLKSERKFSSKSRSHQAGEIFNIRDTLTGFTEEEKDSFKAVLGRNTCVLVKKQKLMPNFRPPIIKQVNDMMDTFYNKPENDIEIIVDDDLALDNTNMSHHLKRLHLGSAKNIDPDQTVQIAKAEQGQNLLPLEDFLNVDAIDDENYLIKDKSCDNTNNVCVSNHALLNYKSAGLDKENGCQCNYSLRKQFMFTCSECDFTCVSVSALADHVKVHDSVEDTRNETLLETKDNNLEEEFVEVINVEDCLEVHDKGGKNLNEHKTFEKGKEVDNELAIIGNCSENIESVPTVDCNKATPQLNLVCESEAFYAAPLNLDEQCTTVPDMNLNLENQLNLIKLNDRQLFLTELSNAEVADKRSSAATPDACADKLDTIFATQNQPKQKSVIKKKSHYNIQKCLDVSISSNNHQRLRGKIKENLNVTGTQECYTQEIETNALNTEISSSERKTGITKSINFDAHKNPTNSIIKSISVLKIKDKSSVSESFSKNSYKVVNLKVVSQGKVNRDDGKTVLLKNATMSSECVEKNMIRAKKVKPDMLDKDTLTDPEICKPEELKGCKNVNTDDSEQEIDVETFEDEDKQGGDIERETASSEIQHSCDSSDFHLVEHAYSQAAVNKREVKPAHCNTKPATCNTKPATCNTKPATCNTKPATYNTNVKTKISQKQEKGNLKAFILRKRPVDSGRPHLYMCDQCSFGCEKKPSLKTHKEKCHGDYVYCPVPDCEFKTLYKRNMALHKMKHDGVKRYLCDKCPYSTPDATCLSSHQKHNHSDAVRFKCTDCDFAAILRLEILRHYRNIHLQQKIYACNQCDYRTGYTYLLKSHLMAHAGIRPYQCSLCDYKVCSANKVNLHIKNVHYGQKDAKCIKLDLTFEIDAKQFKCAEPTNEKDIKVIEMTEEEVKIYVEKKRKEAEIKKAEKERKEKLKLEKLQEKSKSELRKANNKKSSQSKDIKMVSLLEDIMDMKKIQSEASV